MSRGVRGSSRVCPNGKDCRELGVSPLFRVLQIDNYHALRHYIQRGHLHSQSQEVALW